MDSNFSLLSSAIAEENTVAPHANLAKQSNINSRRAAPILLLLMSGLLMVACDSGGGSDGGGTSEPETVVIGSLPAKRNLLPQLAVADGTFEGVHYAGNLVCSACHTDPQAGTEDAIMQIQEEAGMRDVSIGTAWETSIMANATRDPYWHAAVAAELDDFPELADAINDTCTRCHAPMANDMSKKQGFSYQLFDSGSIEEGDYVKGIYTMDKSDELFNHAMEGVSCSFCHQVADDGNLGTDQGMSGGWTVNQLPEENAQDRPSYGQYTDPVQGYMRQQSGFNPIYGAHTSTSEMCATCHNLKTSPVDDDSQPIPTVGHFAEQMGYTEWENSIYDVDGSQPRTCQSCHMPRVDQAVPLASAGGGDPRENFSEHTFLGPNTVMQTMLKNFRDELGVPEHVTDQAFDESIARNRKFLETAATVEVLNAQYNNNVLSMDVKVANLSGHKLPSGYHSRRAYLHVLVTDSTGQVVYENGKMNPNGSIVGVSEDTSPNSYEPHYDKITSATQVQVYQGITGNEEGKQTHALLSATRFLKDNRITPLGFDKHSVPADVEVHGAALDDDDFNQGLDTVSYEMSVTGTAPMNVLVELRYQPMSYGALQVLFEKSDRLDPVDMFRTIYDSTERKDEIIATGVKTVQ